MIEVELDLAVGRHVDGEQRGQAAPVGVAEPVGPFGLGLRPEGMVPAIRGGMAWCSYGTLGPEPPGCRPLP